MTKTNKSSKNSNDKTWLQKDKPFLALMALLLIIIVVLAVIYSMMGTF